MFDQKLAFNKIYAAISSLAEREDTVRLRPSSIGNCPLRLKWSIEQNSREERDPRRDWMTLQGHVNEELFGSILEIAGAEVLKPPSGQAEWEDSVQPDADTGFKPHLDRLIRWPDVGIEDWTILELKYPRTTMQINLFTEGLYADRTYWFQAVAYLVQASKAIENYSAIELRNFEENPEQHFVGLWTDLWRQPARWPQSLLFFSIAKDPSTTRMLFQQRIKPAQYELNGEQRGGKPLTAEQLAMIEWKKQIREKLEAVGGNIDFHMELISRDDHAVRETYEEIKRTVKVITESPDLVQPAHDIYVAEEDLDEECRWYCPFLQQHRDLELLVMSPEEAARLEQIKEDPFARFDPPSIFAR